MRSKSLFYYVSFSRENDSLTKENTSLKDKVSQLESQLSEQQKKHQEQLAKERAVAAEAAAKAASELAAGDITAMTIDQDTTTPSGGEKSKEKSETEKKPSEVKGENISYKIYIMMENDAVHTAQ